MADETELVNIYQKEKEKLNELLAELFHVVSTNELGSDKYKIFQKMQRYTAIRQLAEVENLTASETYVLPNDEEILLALSFKEAKTELEVSKETLECVERKINELEELKANNEKYIKDERYLLSILKEKGKEDGIVDNETGAILNQTLAVEQVDRLSKAKKKLGTVKILKDKRMSQFNDFLLKYFPTSSMDQAQEKKDIFRFHDVPEMKYLGEIIQTLVVKFLTNSHHWLPIEPDMWLPHIELLLRSGIAVRNPNNPSQIRLQKFID